MTTPEDDVAVIEDTPTPVRHASRTPDREREILLNVEALVKHFPIKGGFLQQVHERGPGRGRHRLRRTPRRDVLDRG